MSKYKPILTLDFDGVIHSYTSGWKGATVIPDPPVPGALRFLVEALQHFDVRIHSSRSHHWGGRRAMKRWLRHWLSEEAATYEATPDWLMPEIHAYADPWPDQVDYDVGRIVNSIGWPLFKPPSVVSIDDRCLTFTGVFPPLDELKRFKPWNKR